MHYLEIWPNVPRLLYVIFSVAIQVGSCKMTTICQIPFVYTTWNLEHSSIT